MIKWISNLKGESLSEYAFRLIEAYQINKSDQVAGLSFGGVVAQEIAKILHHNQVILLSSFRDKNDLRPLFYRSLNLGLHNLLPSFKLQSLAEIIVNKLNSGTEESKATLKEMIRSTDYNLMKWSLQKIDQVTYQPDQDLILYNIIGDSDKILKPWENENTIMVKGGSHFMVYDRAAEITEILRSRLKQN